MNEKTFENNYPDEIIRMIKLQRKQLSPLNLTAQRKKCPKQVKKVLVCNQLFLHNSCIFGLLTVKMNLYDSKAMLHSDLLMNI